MYYFVSFHLEEEEVVRCFAFAVIRMFCHCKCSTAPHDAVGWYAVGNCGTSCSYALSYFGISTDMYRFLQSCYILDGAMKNTNLGTQKKNN